MAIQNWQEKLKDALLLSDEDAQSVLKGDFKTVLSRNMEGALRTLSVYGAFLAAVMIFLLLFSVFGGMFKLILMMLFLGVIAAIGAAIGKEAALQATKEPGIFYFAGFLLGMVVMSMFSDITSEGSGASQFLLFLVLGGAVGGCIAMKPKFQEKNWAVSQVVLAALVLVCAFTMTQSAFIRMTIDGNMEYIRQYSEQKRREQAQAMREGFSSGAAAPQACTTEEECKRMNMKKNDYYAQHEAEAMATCENAVAKEITSRFEWTVSPQDYKFTNYQVDVLNDMITLSGDRAQLIDANGNKTQISYRCRYNTRRKTTDVVMNK